MTENRPPTARPAFTLIELLVVTAMLCLLLGLLLPGVQHLRAGAERKQCENNLKQLGQACLAFEKTNGGFPARRTGFQGGGNAKGGWGMQILPFLDADRSKNYHANYDFYDPKNKKLTETPIAAFLCPSAPTGRSITVKDKVSGNSHNPDKDSEFEVAGAPVDFISSNGLFLPTSGWGLNWPLSNQGLSNRHQPMDDDVYVATNRISDGLSTTILLIEQGGKPQVWRMGKRTDQTDLFNGTSASRGIWSGYGSIAFGAFDRKDGTTVGQGNDRDCSVNCNNTFGIYGFHTGGAHILLCDGSVRFVSESLSSLTFAQLTIRDDGLLISPNDF